MYPINGPIRYGHRRCRSRDDSGLTPARGRFGITRRKGYVDSVLTIATVNVNGIRAAYRKGIDAWLAERQPDIIALQEVRAPDDVVHTITEGSGYRIAHTEAEAKGRAGVAILSRDEPETVRIGNGDTYFDRAGRWIEADLPLSNGGTLTVASVYVHSGEVGTPRSEEHTSELQSRGHLVCRLLLEKKKKTKKDRLIDSTQDISMQSW